MTDKQKAFVDEYLIDLNATRAYKAAYPRIKDDNVAAVNGNRLLRNAKVQDCLDKRMKDREKRTEITQDKVLAELASIGFAKVNDYVEVKSENLSGEEIKKVAIKNTNDLTIEQIAAIAGIKQGANGIELKLNDKMKALELLGRHLGMFNDKLDINANVNPGKLDSILNQLKE